MIALRSSAPYWPASFSRMQNSLLRRRRKAGHVLSLPLFAERKPTKPRNDRNGVAQHQCIEAGRIDVQHRHVVEQRCDWWPKSIKMLRTSLPRRDSAFMDSPTQRLARHSASLFPQMPPGLRSMVSPSRFSSE